MSISTRVTTMSAITQDHYGSTDVLEVTSVPVPTPGADQVLVRVRAAGMDAGVWHLMTGRPYLMRIIGFGFRAPKDHIRGLVFAGEVSQVGERVTSVHVGDRVVGSAPGAFAEFVVAPASALVTIPADLTFERAAALPISAVTALQAVRDAARVTDGQRVLVVGAAGGVGSFAVQLAVTAGATVSGVCSGGKAELVARLGATDVIDYAVEDFTAGSATWDVIIDTAGNRPLRRLRRVLDPEGTLVLVGGEQGGAVLGGMERVLAASIANGFTRQRLIGLISRENAVDLATLVAMVADGTLTPVIDTVYPLADTASAIQHIADGRARGKVILSV